MRCMGCNIYDGLSEDDLPRYGVPRSAAQRGNSRAAVARQNLFAPDISIRALSRSDINATKSKLKVYEG